MPRIIMEVVHADTCLPDYWSGHHLAHIQIPVHRGMSLKEIKELLRSELNMGAVMGNGERIMDDSGEIGDRWYKAAHAAINKIKPEIKGQRKFFMDLEQMDEECDHEDQVYAFFVFVDQNK